MDLCWNIRWRYLFDVWIKTYNFINGYYSIDHFYAAFNIFTENLFSVKNWRSYFKFFAKHMISSSDSINSLELRNTPLSCTAKVTEWGIYFAEEPHRLWNWISFWLIFRVMIFFVDLDPFPVSWTLVLRFNRFGSYFLKGLHRRRRWNTFWQYILNDLLPILNLEDIQTMENMMCSC